MTSSWFFLSTQNYDAWSTTHQIKSTLKKTHSNTSHFILMSGLQMLLSFDGVCERCFQVLYKLPRTVCRTQSVSGTWRSVKFYGSRGSVFGEVTSLRTGKLRNHGLIPRTGKRFSLLKAITPALEPSQPTHSFRVGGGSLLRIKRPECEAEYSHSCSADVKL